MFRTRRDKSHVFCMRSRGLIRRKQASCTASASSVVSIVYCIFAMFTILGDRGRSGERSSVGHPDFERQGWQPFSSFYSTKPPKR